MSDNLAFPAIPNAAWSGRDVADKSASPEKTIRDFFHEQSYAFRARNDLASEWKLLIENQQLLEASNRLSLGNNLISAIERLTSEIVELLGKRHLEPQAPISTIFARAVIERRHRVEFDAQLNRAERLTVRKPLRPKSSQFSPSKELTDLWVSSARAFARDASITAIELPRATDVQKEFTKNLTGLFGSIGQQFRYEQIDDTSLTRDSEFTSYFEVEICDRFLILPSRAARFLKLLRDELVSAIKSGAVFQGAWGHIELTDVGELRYVLSPPNRFTQSGFVPAKRVE